MKSLRLHGGDENYQPGPDLDFRMLADTKILENKMMTEMVHVSSKITACSPLVPKCTRAPSIYHNHISITNLQSSKALQLCSM
jgi:hypothetical protein